MQVRMKVFKGGRPSEVPPAELRLLTAEEALANLVSRLFWSTRIDAMGVYNTEEGDGTVWLLVECPDAKPPEFVLYEETISSPDNCDFTIDIDHLEMVALWYAQATGLCSDGVWAIIKDEVQAQREGPFAPTPRGAPLSVSAALLEAIL